MFVAWFEDKACLHQQVLLYKPFGAGTGVTWTYARQTGNRNSPPRSKHLRTAWLQVSRHESSTRCDKAEVTRMPLNSGCISDSLGELEKKKHCRLQPHPGPIRLEFLGVGPRHWYASKSSPADCNMQTGLGTTESQVGSQNCSLRLMLTDSFSCDQLVFTKQALQK